jgi:hypothetical protein
VMVEAVTAEVLTVEVLTAEVLTAEVLTGEVLIGVVPTAIAREYQKCQATAEVSFGSISAVI